MPIGLVIPLDEADVVATIEACREAGAPILPRGAGTSLAGQCCNVAVIMDFSKYLNRILALDPAGKVARVQPGIVLDRVRDAAEVHQLTFAPDPATHSRCTLGGMIGNNSCGVHALMGGKTVDNIHELDVMLYDGTRMTVGKTSDAELDAIIRAGGRKGQIYAGLKDIRDRFAPLIREKFPRIPRRVSGYNLDELLPENGFNVARALVGSEGTCVTVLEATLRLTASPPFRRLVCIGFPDPFIAADHVPQILTFKPIGLEGFDNAIPDSLRSKGMRLDELKLLPEGKGVLLVEFGAWTSEDVDAQAERFGAWLATLNPRPKYMVCTPHEAAAVWHVRESALGAVAIQPGKRPGWEGWEDSAVPPDRLGSYLRAIYALMGEYNYDSPLYGHFGEGCVHMRIDFDLQSEPGIQQFREFIDRATDIVVAHGGSISGEHGDGQSRGALLPKMFGPELMEGFREFKRLWDPDNKMNPGKLIDARQPHADLRLGADYAPRPGRDALPFSQRQRFARERDAALRRRRRLPQGRRRRDVPQLHGDARRETLDARPRASVVGAAAGRSAGRRVAERRCEGRARPVPLVQGVQDRMPDQRRPRDLQGRVPRSLLRRAVAPALCLRVRADRSLGADGLAHAAPRQRAWPFPADRRPREKPSAHRAAAPPAPVRDARRSAARRRRAEAPERANRSEARSPVLLWADTFTNYFQPAIAEAAHQVLSDAGFTVKVLQRHVCCGRPLYDFGMLDKAKQYLTDAMDALAEEISAGTPIVVLEPSCASVFRDEAVNLMPDDPRTAKLKRQTMLLSEFLVQHAPDYAPAKTQQKILVHMHCHHRAIFNMKDEVAVLNATGGDVKVLDSGCCGMAGPFGFEKKSYGVSQTLGERVLLPAVRAAEPAR